MDLFPLEPKNCDDFGENLGHMGSQGRTGIPCVGTAHATRLLHGPRNKDQVCEMNVMLSGPLCTSYLRMLFFQCEMMCRLRAMCL